MTPTATYIAEENCLQELPRMEKPDSKDYTKVVHRPFGEIDCFTDNKYYEDLKQYNAHLATLRKIPCDPSCKGLWADQQKVVEGVDYEIKGADDWKWCYQLKRNIFAAPIVPVSEDDYRQAIALFTDLRLKGCSLDEAIAGVKKSYIIQKRKHGT